MNIRFKSSEPERLSEELISNVKRLNAYQNKLRDDYLNKQSAQDRSNTPDPDYEAA